MVAVFTEEMIAAIPEVDLENMAYARGELMARAILRLVHQKVDVIESRYPASWWDAFKERWYPTWAKKRWPVEYTVRQWQISALYPTLPPPINAHTAVR